MKDNLLIDSSENFINSTNLNNTTSISKNINISTIYIDKTISKKINRRTGMYSTITFNNISNELELLLDLINKTIKSTLKYLKLTNTKKILFIGLGNKDLATDNFGYKIIEKLSINNNTHKIYKNTISNTNILTIDFIKSITSILDIDLVIIFDSLNSTNINRIGKTIQITTSGIAPGSALNNKTKLINKKTIKKEVISIGVPSFYTKDNLIITTPNIDSLIDDISSIISISLNRLF